MQIEYLSKHKACATRERKSVFVERELDDIYKKKGVVTPKLLLDRAREVDHPLHTYFDWDDEKAGEKFRLIQATAMILATRYVAVLQAHDGPPNASATTVQRYSVRKLVGSFSGTGYIERQDALNNPDIRARLIERRVAELRSWCVRVCDVAELQDVAKTIENALAKL